MDILLKKAQKGDHEAYASLFAKYEADLYRFIYTQCGNGEDALDVVQEVAYRSFKYIHTVKEATFFKTWLFRIAINASNDLFKKRTNFDLLDESYAEESFQQLSDLKFTLEAVMTYLTPIEKQVVYLKYYEELTFQEISDMLQVKLGTVKSILYRALSKLKQALHEEGYNVI